jgi:hypothetical protein
MQKHQENTNDQMFIHLISNLIYGYISWIKYLLFYHFVLSVHSFAFL